MTTQKEKIKKVHAAADSIRQYIHELEKQDNPAARHEVVQLAKQLANEADRFAENLQKRITGAADSLFPLV